MSNTNNDNDTDIDALLVLLHDGGWKDFHRALTALVAERDALRKECNNRFDVAKIKELVAERDALKQRVAELESQEFTLPNDPFRDPDSDLRKDLICAVLTGLNSNPELITYAEHFPKFAVNQANEAIVLMRKGDTNEK